jgi:hypothetical protein
MRRLFLSEIVRRNGRGQGADMVHPTWKHLADRVQRLHERLLGRRA